MINNISFRANLINKSTIKRCYKNKTSKDLVASFVELKTDSAADEQALRNLNLRWTNGVHKTLVSSILDHFEDSVFFQMAHRKYYALTLQTQQLETPITDEILGVAEITTGNAEQMKLNYIQVDPKNNMHISNRKYKGVGTAMLNSLKSLFPKHDIVLSTAESAKRFYKANGFEDLGDYNDEMIFRH